MKKETMKNKTGITLIALVITIVVLLILAGISLVALTGDNGLVNQAIKAKEASDLSDVKDEVMQEWYSVQNETRKEYLSNSEMAARIEDRLHAEDPNATVKEQNETFEVVYKGYTLEIGADGQVTSNK